MTPAAPRQTRVRRRGRSAPRASDAQDARGSSRRPRLAVPVDPRSRIRRIARIQRQPCMAPAHTTRTVRPRGLGSTRCDAPAWCDDAAHTASCARACRPARRDRARYYVEVDPITPLGGPARRTVRLVDLTRAGRDHSRSRATCCGHVHACPGLRRSWTGCTKRRLAGAPSVVLPMRSATDRHRGGRPGSRPRGPPQATATASRPGLGDGRSTRCPGRSAGRAASWSALRDEPVLACATATRSVGQQPPTQLCPAGSGPGRYRVDYAGARLTIKLVRDSCVNRKALLIGSWQQRA